MKREMLSNIDWDVIYQEYLRFKEDTNEFSQLGSSLSSAMETLNISKKRKREVSNEENQSEIEKLFKFVQTEEFLDMSSKYGEILVSVGSEMSNIAEELNELSGQLDYLDVETLLTLAISSPRVSAIISSLSKIMEELEVIFSNSPYHQTFLAVKESIVMIDDFVKSIKKNIEISAILLNWDKIKILLEEVGTFTPTEISDIGSTVLSTQGIFLIMSRIEEFICDSEVMGRYIQFFQDQAPLNSTVESLAYSVCGFITSPGNWQNIIRIVDISSAFDFLSSIFRLSPHSLAAAANMTQSELFDTMGNLDAASALFPEVQQSIRTLLTQLNLTEFTTSTISNLFCGSNITDLEVHFKVVR